MRRKNIKDDERTLKEIAARRLMEGNQWPGRSFEARTRRVKNVIAVIRVISIILSFVSFLISNVLRFLKDDGGKARRFIARVFAFQVSVPKKGS